MARIGRLGTALLLVFTSCGGGSASGFIADYCNLLSPCCSMAKLRTDGRQCQAVLSSLVGSAQFDSQAGDACLAQTRAGAGQPDFCSTAGGNGYDACDKVFTKSGAKPPGQTCMDDSECAASPDGKVVCAVAFNGNTEIRKCQVQVRGKQGDNPCAGTQDGASLLGTGSGGTDVPPRAVICYVSDGLRCDKSAGCVKILAAGQPCTGMVPEYECEKTAYCDETQHLCVTRKAVGAACSAVSLYRECIDGAYCNSTTKMCTATLAEGAACTDSDQCASRSCVNGKCGRNGLDDFGLALLCGMP